MLWLVFKKQFFQYCGFETLVKFPIFWISVSNLHIRNENVKLVPIALEPHCKYPPKKHSSWDFCSKVYFDKYPP
jgi:hypothetical protein